MSLKSMSCYYFTPYTSMIQLYINQGGIIWIKKVGYFLLLLLLRYLDC